MLRLIPHICQWEYIFVSARKLGTLIMDLLQEIQILFFILEICVMSMNPHILCVKHSLCITMVVSNRTVIGGNIYS